MGNMHVIIQELQEDCLDKIKIRRMIVVRGKMEYHYICNSCKWNFWFDRYYPVAELLFTVEHLKDKSFIIKE